MSYLWLNLALFAAIVVLVVLANRRRTLTTPRRQRISLRKLFYVALASGAVCACVPLAMGIPPLLALLLGAVLFGLWVLPLGYQVFLRKQTDHEIAVNYGIDPEHCGRCGYDLTGNASGVCPECGWQIPGPSHQWERPDWAIWWKRWQITYLYNWRRSLVGMLLPAMFFAALAVLLLVWGPGDFFVLALFASLTALNMFINVVRIISYARRRSTTASTDGDN